MKVHVICATSDFWVREALFEGFSWYNGGDKDETLYAHSSGLVCMSWGTSSECFFCWLKEMASGCVHDCHEV